MEGDFAPSRRIERALNLPQAAIRGVSASALPNKWPNEAGLFQNCDFGCSKTLTGKTTPKTTLELRPKNLQVLFNQTGRRQSWGTSCAIHLTTTKTDRVGPNRIPLATRPFPHHPKVHGMIKQWDRNHFSLASPSCTRALTARRGLVLIAAGLAFWPLPRFPSYQRLANAFEPDVGRASRML